MARESWFRLVMDAEPGVRMPGLESVTGFRVYGRESRVLGLEWGGGLVPELGFISLNGRY